MNDEERNNALLREQLEIMKERERRAEAWRRGLWPFAQVILLIAIIMLLIAAGLSLTFAAIQIWGMLS